MPASVVKIDTSAVEDMLAQLDRNSQKLSLERAGENALQTISGIPVDTGALESSPRVLIEPRVQGTLRLRIVSDTDYAKFVFRGHKTRGDGYVEAVPPQIGYTAEDLARDIAQELELR